MALVICDMSVSLDGYVTGPNDDRENPFGDGAHTLHDWLSDAATDADRALLREYIDGTGAIVMGRRSFDKNEGDGAGATAGRSVTRPASWSPTARPHGNTRRSTRSSPTSRQRSHRRRTSPATRRSGCTARRSCSRPCLSDWWTSSGSTWSRS